MSASPVGDIISFTGHWNSQSILRYINTHSFTKVAFGKDIHVTSALLKQMPSTITYLGLNPGVSFNSDLISHLPPSIHQLGMNIWDKYLDLKGIPSRIDTLYMTLVTDKWNWLNHIPHVTRLYITGVFPWEHRYLLPRGLTHLRLQLNNSVGDIDLNDLPLSISHLELDGDYKLKPVDIKLRLTHISFSSMDECHIKFLPKSIKIADLPYTIIHESIIPYLPSCLEKIRVSYSSYTVKGSNIWTYVPPDMRPYIEYRTSWDDHWVS